MTIIYFYIKNRKSVVGHIIPTRDKYDEKLPFRIGNWLFLTGYISTEFENAIAKRIGFDRILKSPAIRDVWHCRGEVGILRSAFPHSQPENHVVKVLTVALLLSVEYTVPAIQYWSMKRMTDEPTVIISIYQSICLFCYVGIHSIGLMSIYYDRLGPLIRFSEIKINYSNKSNKLNCFPI